MNLLDLIEKRYDSCADVTIAAKAIPEHNFLHLGQWKLTIH
jgi:hypothetical protein